MQLFSLPSWHLRFGFRTWYNKQTPSYFNFYTHQDCYYCCKICFNFINKKNNEYKMLLFIIQNLIIQNGEKYIT